ncbi:hypothetical protein pb186bvf_001779 [Paramecium bursaria]
MDIYLDQMEQISAERQVQIMKSQKKPKFRLQRVPEELRIVKVFLDIPYGEYMIRDNFEWNLNDQYVSPLEYCEKFVTKLGFGDVKSLHKQLMFQLMEYIEKHSFALQEQQQPIKNKTSERKKNNRPTRQPTSAQKIQRVSYGQNKKCSNCETINLQSGLYCKKCKLPFMVLDSINCQDPLKKACLLFYDIVAKSTPNVEPRKLVKEDFNSLYTLKARLLDMTDEEDIIEDIFQEFMRNKDNPDLISVIQQSRSTKRTTRRQKQESEEKSQQEDVGDLPQGDDVEDKIDEESNEDGQGDDDQEEEENSDNDNGSQQSSDEQEKSSSSSSSAKMPKTRTRVKRINFEPIRRSIRKKK